jgi:26S proteasome regulatory subunit N2
MYVQTIIEGIFTRCIEEGEYKQVCNISFVLLVLTHLAQAIGIALESHRFDIISQIYAQTKDISLLSYAMEAILDTRFSLSYRDQVLHLSFPLFPQPTIGDKSPHVHALTRLLVTLSRPSLTVPLLTSLIPKETLLAYQFAFDLVEGGAQDFLESVRNDLPEGEAVSMIFPRFTNTVFTVLQHLPLRIQKRFMTNYETY